MSLALGTYSFYESFTIEGINVLYSEKPEQLGIPGKKHRDTPVVHRDTPVVFI